MPQLSNSSITNDLPVGMKKIGQFYTVILIDDSNTAREILKRILLSLQFKILFEAVNGEIAINKIKALKTMPDFIFIDMEMPLMNGIETIKQIKPLVPETKIIMVTGHGEKEMVMELISLGVIGYIKKPYDRDTVVKQMASILGRPLPE
jgi:two-component system response regulator DegU